MPGNNSEKVEMNDNEDIFFYPFLQFDNRGTCFF